LIVEEIRIGRDPLEVVVLPEAGARLHRIRAFGHDLLRAPDDPDHHREDPLMWGGYVMAPWCNRIEPEPVAAAGRTIEIGANFVDGTAIHGQVYVRPWQVDGPGSFVVRGGGDGWPWRYEVRERIAVVGHEVRVALTLTNLDDGPMPAGIGLHPWFLAPLEVAIRGDVVYDPNTDSPPLPTPVAGTTDLRRLAPMTEGLDATWSATGDPPVELRWPTLGVRAVMHVQAPVINIVAACPVGAGAVAVEPETHAPRGLRRLLDGEPDAMAMLDPGATLALTMSLAFTREASAS
jgi:aldose 1-epimerase